MLGRSVRMSWSGRAKRVSSSFACVERGVSARRLVGRFDRGSADVGMLSGPSPDIVGFARVSCAWCGMFVSRGLLVGLKTTEARYIISLGNSSTALPCPVLPCCVRSWKHGSCEKMERGVCPVDDGGASCCRLLVGHVL